MTWHPATNTLHVESDEQLDQHTTYLFVVTTGVRDAAGSPIEAANWRRELNFGQTKSGADKAYRKALLDALRLLPAGVHPNDVAAASLFTTQSITALLEQIAARSRRLRPRRRLPARLGRRSAPCSRAPS